ncbi:MAG TPA: ATP-dependent zinc metalloprotease FtsH [Usitatibacter sp.]|nr:ATP-dependent zinc metalloprotease FtsH [Usitatibacter sp.]
MNAKQHGIPLAYLLALILAIFALRAAFVSENVETIPYSRFKTLVQEGKVDDLTILEDRIAGEIRDGAKPPHRFVTIRVSDPVLVAELQAARVPFSGEVQSKWLVSLLSWILPAVIFVAVWAWVAKRMGGGGAGLMAIGKSRARVYVEKETGVTFADVAGVDEAKEELVEVLDFLRHPERYVRLGGKIPKGVLIVGAPGTGKTLLAKAVAGEAGVPFLSLSGSEFVEMFVGVGAARVRDLFAQAQSLAPCIIFIDELDALGRTRGVAAFGGHEEREQTLNQLLVEMDGFDSTRGVILLAATNRPEILDPALLRPGRFDRHIALDRPDIRGRRQILDVHVRKVKLGPDVDLDALAAKTPGFAGADLANLVNEATLRAARAGAESVKTADFDEALDRIVAGLEKKNRVMNPREKRIAACHEAGHAVVAERRPAADKPVKVSIIPRGIAALGYTRQQPTEDRYLLQRGELLDRLDVLLGGRVAEELLCGDISTGAQNDLQRATDLAREMVTRYGMSEAVGLATYESAANPFLPPVSEAEVPRRECSERVAQQIDREITRLLEESHQRVTATLRAERSALERLADLLMDKEVVDRPMLDTIFAGATPAIGKAVRTA